MNRPDDRSMSQDVANGPVGSMQVDARVGHEGRRIDLDDLTKRYRVGDTDVTALDGVNLHVDESAFVAIVGPSGCGKTTLLNMIGALDTPTSGSVRVAGVDLTSASRPIGLGCDGTGQLHLPDVQPVPGPHGARERAFRG
jgi:ABC-type glutathione transport system ATPase component